MSTIKRNLNNYSGLPRSGVLETDRHYRFIVGTAIVLMLTVVLSIALVESRPTRKAEAVDRGGAILEKTIPEGAIIWNSSERKYSKPAWIKRVASDTDIFEIGCQDGSKSYARFDEISVVYTFQKGEAPK